MGQKRRQRIAPAETPAPTPPLVAEPAPAVAPAPVIAQPAEPAVPLPPPAPLEAIEVLAARLRLPEWQARGLAAHEKWARGKQVTEAAYGAALEAWLNGPM